MMHMPECVTYNLKLQADIYLPFFCLFVYGFLCICVFGLKVLDKLDFFSQTDLVQYINSVLSSFYSFHCVIM